MITHIALYAKSIEYDVIEIQSRFMLDTFLSDIYFKNEMARVWTTLKIILIHTAHNNNSVIHKSQFDQRNRKWTNLRLVTSMLMTDVGDEIRWWQI